MDAILVLNLGTCCKLGCSVQTPTWKIWGCVLNHAQGSPVFRNTCVDILRRSGITVGSDLLQSVLKRFPRHSWALGTAWGRGWEA